MEKQKDFQRVLITLLFVVNIVLLVLCILFATGTISFKDDNIDNENIVENDNDFDEQSIAGDKYTRWSDYLFSRNILEAKIVNFDESSNPIEKIITLDDARNLLSDIEDNTTPKIYYSGLGGSSGGYISVSYEYNSQEYGISIWVSSGGSGLFYTSSLDSDFVKFLTNSGFEIAYEADVKQNGIDACGLVGGNILDLINEYY
jgi:hypothetical protein